MVHELIADAKKAQAEAQNKQKSYYVQFDTDCKPISIQSREVDAADPETSTITISRVEKDSQNSGKTMAFCEPTPLINVLKWIIYCN